MITDDCQTCGHPLTVNWAECEKCGEAVSTDKFAAIVDTHEQLVNANTRQAGELLRAHQVIVRAARLFVDVLAAQGCSVDPQVSAWLCDPVVQQVVLTARGKQHV